MAGLLSQLQNIVSIGMKLVLGRDNTSNQVDNIGVIELGHHCSLLHQLCLVGPSVILQRLSILENMQYVI